MRSRNKRWRETVTESRSRMKKIIPERTTSKWKDDICKDSRVLWMTETSM